ncbi:ABC transporter substrate-binding protein [Micromonosporaceae bacterium Da 78-11]
MKIKQPRNVLVAAGLVLALTAAAGCGGKTADNAQTSGTTAANGAQFDQQIHDRLPEEIRTRGSVRFVTDASYAPMEHFAADGRTIIGFDPDLASALSAVLGIKIEMVVGDFGTMLDELGKGTYDGVLSSMTDTVDREKKADFLDYFSAGTSIIVQRGNPKGVTDVKDLCGQVVAAEKGTVQADLLRRSQRGCGDNPMTINEYKTNSDALLQLRTGRAVAVLNDFPPAAYLASDTRTRAYYQLSSTVQYEPGLFGIAFAKNQTALRDAMRDALDRLIRSGAYTELLQRWGLATGGLAASSVNAGSGTSTGS